MKKLILVTLVLCMALSACTKAEVGKAPTAESAAASSVESTASGGKSAASEVSLPEKTKTAAHVTKTLSSGVVVDADVTMPESMQKTELPEMKGTGHEVAHEGLSEVFFGGAEVESTVTEIADNGYFSSDTMHELWQVGDAVLSAVGDSAAYSNGRATTAMYLFSEYASSLPFGDNRAVYLTGKNLDFATIDEVKAKVQTYIDALGVSVLEPTCYTMDYDTMRDVYDGRTALETYDADFDFIIEPQKKDEQYIFDYPIAVNGMPLGNFEGGGYSDDSYMTGTFLRMTYGEEGIRAMTLPYALDVTEVGAMQPVLTLDEALQIVDDKYNSIIMEGNYKIDKIEMAYTPIQQQNVTEAKIIPVWRFQTNHTLQYSAKNDSNEIVEMTDTSYILINALDGTELLKNNGSI
ncbi:DUF6034 family protein [Hominenteromicrobium sp.]|uniref:DUF6034 family protein n=1 Tax=Hominenteromicrobium sp. TaxID=3073581 RepID=UPI003A93992B